ncbi:MAG: hypothetical protein IKB86_07495 [Clostridia bacterium]|nr:hypothetical protein [Clostridia bacterium]
MGTSRRTKQREMKKNLLAAGIVLVFAVAVFSINSVGKFMAQRVIDPLMNIGAKQEEKVSTETVSCKKTEMFLVSAGLFEEKAEAEAAIKNVSSAGGGGYCLKTDSGYHVMHSCYKDKASAEASVQRLQGTFKDAAVVTLKVDKISLKITGTSAQTETVKGCIDFLSAATETLAEVSAKVAEEELTSLKASGELQKLASRQAESERALRELESSNTFIVAMQDMMALCSTLFAELPQSSDAEFNRKLNYVSCAFACEYVKFCSDLE